jgi:hypothetical protein
LNDLRAPAALLASQATAERLQTPVARFRQADNLLEHQAFRASVADMAGHGSTPTGARGPETYRQANFSRFCVSNPLDFEANSELAADAKPFTLRP